MKVWLVVQGEPVRQLGKHLFYLKLWQEIDHKLEQGFRNYIILP